MVIAIESKKVSNKTSYEAGIIKTHYEKKFS